MIYQTLLQKVITKIKTKIQVVYTCTITRKYIKMYRITKSPLINKIRMCTLTTNRTDQNTLLSNLLSSEKDSPFHLLVSL